MKRLTYNIARGRSDWDGGPFCYQEVKGWTTQTSGLAVRNDDRLKWTPWGVDHLASGLNVGKHFATRTDAIAYAERLGTLGVDWTQSLEVIQTPAVRDLVMGVAA